MFNLPLCNSSFVPFKAYKLDSPRVVWVNLSLLHSKGLFLEDSVVTNKIVNYILDNFSFSTLANKDNEYSIFYAERYGGQGISYNGGGARCGLKDNFQVKGIGPTPLVSKDAPYWYSNGLFPLAEAIKELVWSEVLNVILPFGAVRCLAIIESDINAYLDIYKEKVECKGGLLVRENELRVAHMERASLFLDSLTDQVSDFVRTEKAVHSFLSNNDLENGNDVFDFVADKVKRWAMQMAVARSYGLMHGSLSSSNMCLEGKWIDFGTTTSVANYANVISALGSESFWDEHNALCSSIHEFIFHLKKFSSFDISFDANEVVSIFLETLCYEQKKAFMLRFGFQPMVVSRLVELNNFDAFYSEFFRLLRLGKMEEHTGLVLENDSAGKYSIPKIACLLSGVSNYPHVVECKLVHLFDLLVFEYFEKYDVDLKFLLNEYIDTSDILLWNMGFLNYDVLHSESLVLIANGGDLNKYIDEKILTAKMVGWNYENKY